MKVELKYRLIHKLVHTLKFIKQLLFPIFENKKNIYLLMLPEKGIILWKIKASMKGHSAEYLVNN